MRGHSNFSLTFDSSSYRLLWRKCIQAGSFSLCCFAVIISPVPRGKTLCLCLIQSSCRILGPAWEWPLSLPLECAFRRESGETCFAVFGFPLFLCSPSCSHSPWAPSQASCQALWSQYTFLDYSWIPSSWVLHCSLCFTWATH